jgi:hypothetical protein
MRKSFLALVVLAFCPLLVAQQSLNNDAVMKLVKAGLSDDLIVSTINSQAGTYDTSADGLIALKGAGVSDKVVAAMVAKANAPAQPAPPPAVAASSAPGLPPGIDEVGAYYKDKTGAWAAIPPEIVNFKSGGVLKSIATDGLVKGDMNGHIQGPNGKTKTTFPVVLAVYVPEGTAITEYQLLRLRTHSDGREFRSVTGGIVHSSGGATRDAVEFQSQKLAPRLYQITLPATLGKGEYGLLPPGSVSSSNMASGGKIYSLSIPE